MVCLVNTRLSLCATDFLDYCTGLTSLWFHHFWRLFFCLFVCFGVVFCLDEDCIPGWGGMRSSAPASARCFASNGGRSSLCSTATGLLDRTALGAKKNPAELLTKLYNGLATSFQPLVRRHETTDGKKLSWKVSKLHWPVARMANLPGWLCGWKS